MAGAPISDIVATPPRLGPRMRAFATKFSGCSSTLFASWVVLPLLVLSITACSSPREVDPDIATLYKRAASIETRNPVVVIHGILGARLQDRETSRSVWGAFGSSSVDPGSAEGQRLLALSLTPPKSARD